VLWVHTYNKAKAKSCWRQSCPISKYVSRGVAGVKKTLMDLEKRISVGTVMFCHLSKSVWRSLVSENVCQIGPSGWCDLSKTNLASSENVYTKSNVGFAGKRLFTDTNFLHMEAGRRTTRAAHRTLNTCLHLTRGSNLDSVHIGCVDPHSPWYRIPGYIANTLNHRIAYKMHDAWRVSGFTLALPPRNSHSVQ